MTVPILCRSCENKKAYKKTWKQDETRARYILLRLLFSWTICYVDTVAGQLNSPLHDLVFLDLPFVPLIKHIRPELLISL